MNPDGSQQYRLTQDVSDKGKDRHRWSPDGTKIAYVAFTGHGPISQRSVQLNEKSPSDD